MIQAALHLTIAAIICLLAGGAPPSIFLVSLTLALLPDADTPKSIIGSLMRPVSAWLERRVGHRTGTHSAIAVAAVAALAYLVAPAWWALLAGCYASHIALDLLIGRQGVQLLWPAPEWLTIAGWRDDGAAPRRLLIALLPLLLFVAVWPQLGIALDQPLRAAAAAANPIATTVPTRTPQPGMSVSFELPPGVPFSAVTVHAEDVIAEGQILARWDLPNATPWPTPTTPRGEPSPTPVSPAVVVPPPPSDRSALVLGLAELSAAQRTQVAEREELRLRHEREQGEARRRRDQAAIALAQLQPLHEREQAEAQLSVDTVAQDFAAAQAALSATEGDGIPQAEEHLRRAQAAIAEALNAQTRMRTEQGVEREQLELALSQTQGDLDALPGRQDAERGALASRSAAELARAQGRVDAARSALDTDAARAEDSYGRAQATAQAQARATSTAATTGWQELHAAQAGAHATASAATAAALPTPAPSQIISWVAGRVIRVKAEQVDGQLIVSLEIATE